MENSMTITTCTIPRTPRNRGAISIQATIDGQELSVPLDPANRHYAEILKQVEAGTLTVADAE